MAKMYFPDYTNCILNLMGSLARGLGGKTGYNPLLILTSNEIKKAKNVVLIILDGLGYEYLMNYGKNSELVSHLRGKITSIFPAVTTSCVPAFLTGTSAQEHGMTGWHIFLREVGAIIVPLTCTTRFGNFPLTKETESDKLFKLSSFSKKIKARAYTLNPVEFYDSDFNVKCAGKSECIGYDGISDFFKKIERVIKKKSKKRKFVYAYHPYPDSLMHEHGNEHKKVLREFKKIDMNFKKFLKKIKNTNSLIIVTADHGLITVPKNKWIDTHKIPELNNFLRMPLCGEGRMAYAYIKSGMGTEFEKFVKKNLRVCCDLWKSEELVRKGFFGKGKMHPEFKNRIGDYVLIMKENYGIKDFLINSNVKDQHLGRHGGTSKEEMFVPLIVVKK